MAANSGGNQDRTASPGSSLDHRPNGKALQLHLFSRPDEVDSIRPLVADAYEESPFAHFAFSEAKARRRLDHLTNTERQSGYYVMFGDCVVGIAEVVVGPHFQRDHGLLATCLAFYFPAKRRNSRLGARIAALMLPAMKSWARAKGAP